MRKPGTDENNVQMTDVVCDFCRSEWTDERPMVEGHRGSTICGKCLATAYASIVLNDDNTAPTGFTCTLCLEQRDDAGWQSPAHDEAVVCRRCIKQSAGVLHKSDEYNWSKPNG